MSAVVCFQAVQGAWGSHSPLSLCCELEKAEQLFSLVPTLGQKGKVESSIELERDLVIRPTWGISLTFCFQSCVVLGCVLKGHMTGTGSGPLTGRDFGLAPAVV